MRLAVNELTIGSATNDERLLDQLDGLNQKLDEESDELLRAFSADKPSENGTSGETAIGRFGVVYVKDLDEDKAVGCLKYRLDGSVLRIDGLYVEKEYRRHCVGFAMMKTFYDRCRALKASKINLGCIASNKSGLEFYKNEGYRISDATYILDGKEGCKKGAAPVKERAFSEEGFDRIWNEMASSLDKTVNLPEEVEALRKYYVQSKSLKPFAVCEVAGIECAVLADEADSELYVVASNWDASALTKESLDVFANAFLQYAKKRKMKNVCVADIHLPSDLGEKSVLWKEVGYTLYKMASDLQPRKSKLKI